MTINGKRGGKTKVTIHSDVVYAEEPLSCMKLQFDSESAARAGRGRGVRAYKCALCSKWHRTSRTDGYKKRIP